MLTLIWFREDLRVHDQRALAAAANHSSNKGLIGLYVLDTSMWQKHGIATCRIDFILQGLQSISHDLAKLNIPLLLLEANKTSAIPSKIYQLMKQYQADTLFFNKQYEFNEAKRDQAVIDYLSAKNISCQSDDDLLILTPGSVRNQQGDYFKVFSAFKRTWLQRFSETGGIKLAKAPKAQAAIEIASSPIPEQLSEFAPSQINQKLWPAGEQHAARRLNKFIDQALFNYNQQRDFPAIMGTSRLSPYLATGMISARQCFQAALQANQQRLDSGNKGALTWMSELIWREFYKTILIAVPRISMDKAYQANTDKIEWDFDQEQFDAWQNGMTGYPLIDAAMRQLNQTGWMHNRLRMVVAMFFVKNLFFYWRLGESYFCSKLIDSDLAANNGGWQWCASTGTDAAPYFRIFNPITQSKRFDPEAVFIKRYCPELKDCDLRYIHDPFHKNFTALNYPEPIIELNAKRSRVLAAYKNT